MKHCSICGAEIIPGENGCSMYDTCFICKPINYCPVHRNTPKNQDNFNDYEDAILERQDEYDL